MSDPLDIPSTIRDILATRMLVMALGEALVKKGVISHSDVATELSATLRGAGAVDEGLKSEVAKLIGAVVVWGADTQA